MEPPPAPPDPLPRPAPTTVNAAAGSSTGAPSTAGRRRTNRSHGGSGHHGSRESLSSLTPLVDACYEDDAAAIGVLHTRGHELRMVGDAGFEPADSLLVRNMSLSACRPRLQERARSVQLSCQPCNWRVLVRFLCFVVVRQRRGLQEILEPSAAENGICPGSTTAAPRRLVWTYELLPLEIGELAALDVDVTRFDPNKVDAIMAQPTRSPGDPDEVLTPPLSVPGPPGLATCRQISVSTVCSAVMPPRPKTRDA